MLRKGLETLVSGFPTGVPAIKRWPTCRSSEKKKKKFQSKSKLVRIGSIPLTELGNLKALILNTESDGIWDVLVEVVAALQHAEASSTDSGSLMQLKLAAYLVILPRC